MIEELGGDFFQHLRGFYFTAKTGSIRKAAQLMNRNPSTISWQIRQLEQQLDTVLFDRYMKRLRITPEGERLLSWTISTFELLRSMKSDINAALDCCAERSPFPVICPFLHERCASLPHFVGNTLKFVLKFVVRCRTKPWTTWSVPAWISA